MTPDAGTNVVDVYINYLRKKLGAASVDDDAGHGVIETVRGEGYRMGSAEKKQPVSMEVFVGHSALAGA